MFSWKLTDHLELVVLELHHAEDLYNLILKNQEILKPYFAYVSEEVSIDTVKDYIRSYLDGLKDNSMETFGIFYKGELAGEIGFEWLDLKHKAASFVYWIGSDFQGKGIVTQAARCLMHRAFILYGVEKINIFAAANNIKSRKVAERLGFKLDGIERRSWLIDGKFLDKAIYSILKEEWTTLRAGEHSNSMPEGKEKREC